MRLEVLERPTAIRMRAEGFLLVIIVKSIAA